MIAGITGVQARIAAIRKKILFLKVSAVETSENPFPLETKMFATACPRAERSLNLKSIVEKKVTTRVNRIPTILGKSFGFFWGLIIYFSSTRNKNQ